MTFWPLALLDKRARQDKQGASSDRRDVTADNFQAGGAEAEKNERFLQLQTGLTGEDSY